MTDPACRLPPPRQSLFPPRSAALVAGLLLVDQVPTDPARDPLVTPRLAAPSRSRASEQLFDRARPVSAEGKVARNPHPNNKRASARSPVRADRRLRWRTEHHRL